MVYFVLLGTYRELARTPESDICAVLGEALIHKVSVTTNGASDDGGGDILLFTCRWPWHLC